MSSISERIKALEALLQGSKFLDGQGTPLPFEALTVAQKGVVIQQSDGSYKVASKARMEKALTSLQGKVE